VRLPYAFLYGLALMGFILIFGKPAPGFGPIPKKDQCISVNAMIQRNCAPVYMCNGPKGTNADWCCSDRWAHEERKLLQWYRENCPKWIIPMSDD